MDPKEDGVPRTVVKNMIADLDTAAYPESDLRRCAAGCDPQRRNDADSVFLSPPGHGSIDQ